MALVWLFKCYPGFTLNCGQCDVGVYMCGRHGFIHKMHTLLLCVFLSVCSFCILRTNMENIYIFKNGTYF